MPSLLHHQQARAAVEGNRFPRLVANMGKVVVWAVRGGQWTDADHYGANRRKTIGVYDVMAARHRTKRTDQQRLVLMPTAGEFRQVVVDKCLLCFE